MSRKEEYLKIMLKNFLLSLAYESQAMPKIQIQLISLMEMLKRDRYYRLIAENDFIQEHVIPLVGRISERLVQQKGDS